MGAWLMTAASNRIRDFFERWARLEEDKAAISADLRELFKEAKGEGFDTKAMRAAFRREAMDHEELAKKDEHESTVDLYLAALHGNASHARPAPAREEQDRSICTTAETGTGIPERGSVADVASEPAGSSGDEIPAPSSPSPLLSADDGGHPSTPTADAASGDTGAAIEPSIEEDQSAEESEGEPHSGNEPVPGEPSSAIPDAGPIPEFLRR